MKSSSWWSFMLSLDNGDSENPISTAGEFAWTKSVAPQLTMTGRQVNLTGSCSWRSSSISTSSSPLSDRRTSFSPIEPSDPKCTRSLIVGNEGEDPLGNEGSPIPWAFRLWIRKKYFEHKFFWQISHCTPFDRFFEERLDVSKWATCSWWVCNQKDNINPTYKYCSIFLVYYPFIFFVI